MYRVLFKFYQNKPFYLLFVKILTNIHQIYRTFTILKISLFRINTAFKFGSYTTS